MATMNSVIEHVDSIKPNAYTENDKYKWINTLEGLVSIQVFGENLTEYDLPKDADTTLLIPYPFDDIYELYVSSMIDYHNREYNSYNNAVLMFTERMEQFKTWYIQRNPHGKARNFRNVMG